MEKYHLGLNLWRLVTWSGVCFLFTLPCLSQTTDYAYQVLDKTTTAPVPSHISCFERGKLTSSFDTDNDGKFHLVGEGTPGDWITVDPLAFNLYYCIQKYRPIKSERITVSPTSEGHRKLLSQISNDGSAKDLALRALIFNELSNADELPPDARGAYEVQTYTTMAQLVEVNDPLYYDRAQKKTVMSPGLTSRVALARRLLNLTPSGVIDQKLLETLNPPKIAMMSGGDRCDTLRKVLDTKAADPTTERKIRKALGLPAEPLDRSAVSKALSTAEPASLLRAGLALATE